MIIVKMKSLKIIPSLLFIFFGVFPFDNSVFADTENPKDYKVLSTNKKTLSIGDNLNTDIKGANLLNFDSLIISNGIHKNEIKENGIEATAKSYETICNYIQSDLKW